MRDINFAVGEFYHIFNRGVDKRIIYDDHADINRFFESMTEFNTVSPIGGIYEARLAKGSLPRHLVSRNGGGVGDPKLVNIIAYCLNPNHYHFLLEQIEEKGIEKFMQRIGNGYTKYFNARNKRTGSLFSGTYKAVYIETNEQLLHTSVYVNLNNREYQNPQNNPRHLVSRSSWDEYCSPVSNPASDICSKEVILGQFKSPDEYKKFALSSYEDILANKLRREELRDLR